MRNHPATVALLADEYQEYRKLVVDQIAQVLNEAGYGVVCITGKELDPAPKYHQDYAICNSIYTASKEYQFAGYILMSGGLGASSTIKKIEDFIGQLGTKCVVNFGLELPGVASVAINDTKPTHEMYTHVLNQRNHKVIAFVSGKSNDQYSAEREKIFRSIAARKGYSTNCIVRVEGNYDTRETYDKVVALLKENPQIGFIAAANDAMAVSTVRAVRASGLRVPDDVMVTGFDDTQEATRVFPALSTVRQPVVEAAIQCAELLLHYLDNPEALTHHKTIKQIKVSSTFIERGSTASQSKNSSLQSLTKETIAFRLKQSMCGLESPKTLPIDELCEKIKNSLDSSPIDIESNLLSFYENSAPTLQNVHWWTNLCHQIEAMCKNISHDTRYSNNCAVVTAALTAVRAKIWDSSMNIEFDKLRTNNDRTEMQLQMSSCIEECDILDTMGRWLHASNIDRCYLVRYANPGPSHDDKSSLLYAYEKDNFERRPAFTFCSKNILPVDYTYVVKQGLTVQTPVYAGKDLFGYLLLDPSGIDYLYLDRAAQSIGNAMRNQYLIKQLEQQANHLQASNHELVKLANYDELTALPNRLQFNEMLGSKFEHSQSNGAALTLLFIDLDGFKLVNDTLGHRAGDDLLKEVANRLRLTVQENIQDSGFIARLGGDEFTVLISADASIDRIDAFSDAVLKSLSGSYTISKRTINISASIGMATFPGHAQTAEELIKNADSAMYRAKEKGKNQSAWYNSDLKVFNETLLQMDNDMRNALDTGDICMHYQPRVNLDTGLISAVEALMRWNIDTPEGKRVRTRPDIFISVAEKTGFISKLDAFALDEACRQARDWELASTPLLVAVNISVLHLQQDDFVETVIATMEKYSLSPQLLELEITESAVMTQVDTNVDKLHKLRELGVKLSIDDFGTGYSSLSYLKQLPVNNLKIDKSFISDIDSLRMRRSADAAIVRSIIALGRSMNFQIIAEGIETEPQRQFLRSLGCHEAQGYLFARPSPASDITQMLGQSTLNCRQA